MSPQTRTGLIAVAIVGGMALCAGGGVLALAVSQRGKDTGRTGSRLFGVSPSIEGEKWTIREFVEYVQANGARFDVADYGNFLGRVPFAVVKKDGQFAGQISQLETVQKAREDAAAHNDEASFSWGRFSVRGKRSVVDAVRKALGAT